MRSFIKRTLALATMLALITVSFSACKPVDRRGRSKGSRTGADSAGVRRRRAGDARRACRILRAGGLKRDRQHGGAAGHSDAGSNLSGHHIRSNAWHGSLLCGGGRHNGVAYYAVKNDWLIPATGRTKGQTAESTVRRMIRAADAALPGDGAEERRMMLRCGGFKRRPRSPLRRDAAAGIAAARRAQASAICDAGGRRALSHRAFLACAGA